jgi:hypothetical protein
MKNRNTSTIIILLLAVSNLSAATHYVSLASTNPTPPFTNWATATTSIQPAMGASAAGDVVVVSNGVYWGGVSVTGPLTLQSLNGPEATVIDGGGAVRCVILGSGAKLIGFTLANGVAENGGGVYCLSTSAVLSNCVLTGNVANGYDGFGGGALGGTLNNCTLTGNYSAFDGGGVSSGGGTLVVGCVLNNCTLTGNWAAYFGGGAEYATLNNCTLTGNSAEAGGGTYFGTLNNCTLTGNRADFGGGGACNTTLNNCTLTGNSAGYGGGASASTLNNCIVYYSTASDGGANYDAYGYSKLNYCCTTPLPTNGVGNITDAPLFVDYAHANLRLQSNSPCINAGNNAYATNCTDLDGRPRLVGGTADMGAYEFQPGISGAFIGWLQQYGLATDGSADYTDPDHDGLNNWHEWMCGTDPTNRLSALRLLSANPAGANVTVSWQSVAGVNYFLERTTNLGSPFALMATNIVGQAGITSYANTNAAGAGPVFYRVGVQSW